MKTIHTPVNTAPASHLLLPTTAAWIGVPMRLAIPTGTDASPSRRPERVTSLSRERTAGKYNDTTRNSRQFYYGNYLANELTRPGEYSVSASRESVKQQQGHSSSVQDAEYNDGRDAGALCHNKRYDGYIKTGPYQASETQPSRELSAHLYSQHTEYKPVKLQNDQKGVRKIDVQIYC